MNILNMSNEYIKQWHLKRYERLKRQGICPRCGKEKSKEGRTYCQACLNKIKNYRQGKGKYE